MNPIISLCLLALVAASANAGSHANWRILNTKGGLEHVVENVQAPNVEALKTPQFVQAPVAYQQTLPAKGFLPEQESFLQAPQPTILPLQQTSFAPVVQVVQQQPRLVYYSAPVLQQSYPIKGYQPIQETLVQAPQLSVPIQQANFLPEVIQQQPRVVQQAVVTPVLQQSLPVKGFQQEVRSNLVQEPLVQQSAVASQAPLVASTKV